MKKIVKILSLVLVVVALFALSSCAENEELKIQTEQMLNALIDGDFESAYNLVSDITTKEQFREPYTQMKDYIGGVTEYELTQVGINSNLNNGISSVSATYLMKTNAKTYMVEAQIRSDVEGLYGFRILESQISNDGLKCGTITTMKGANVTQWIFLIIGLLEIAFVIVVFIDALKQKFNKKGLWLALILLGTVAITINSNANGINFNFSAIISLVNSTAFIKYATGASSVRIMIPLAAIIYLINRKKLLESFASSNTTDEETVINENAETEQNSTTAVKDEESIDQSAYNCEDTPINNEENNE